MGQINSKRIMGVQVKTRDGRMIGKVSSLDIDADTGHLVNILVATSFVSGLLNDELIISWSQIISINAEEVIVSDLVVPAGASSAAIA